MRDYKIVEVYAGYYRLNLTTDDKLSHALAFNNRASAELVGVEWAGSAPA